MLAVPGIQLYPIPGASLQPGWNAGIQGGEPGLRDAPPLKKAQELSSGQLGLSEMLVARDGSVS